jgi:hypothetical protein
MPAIGAGEVSDVNGGIINREPLRVVAGVEFRQPDAPHDRRRIGHREFDA